MTAPAVHPYVLTALTRLARLYGHEWSSPEDMKAYADTLADLDPAAVDRACTEVAKRERYWPRPITIRRAVDFVQQRERRPALPPRGVPEIYTDDDGVTHELFACRECQDRGWLPVIEGGEVVSWDRIRGIGEFAGNAIRNRAVKRCERCGKIGAPRPRAADASFEDNPRRGRFE